MNEQNLNSVKIKQTLEVAAVPIISLFVVVLLVLFGISPSLSNIFEAKKTYEKNETRLGLLESKTKELASINEGEIRLQVDKLSLAIPPDKSIPGLLTGLERMAAEASASVETFSIAPGKISTDSASAASASAVQVVEKKDVAPYIEFQIGLVGSFDSLRAFLTRLANASRILGVKSVAFTSSNTKSRGDNVSTTITLKAYYLPYPEFLGEITDPVDKLSSKETAILEKVSSYEVFTVPPGFGLTGKPNPFSRF